MSITAPRKDSFMLRLERTIGASARAAFAAFTQADELNRWFTSGAKTELRPGGRYSNDSGDRGTFLAVDPPHHLEFTWENPLHCPGTVVKIAFTSTSDDQVVVTLEHLRLTSDSDVEAMTGGWDWALDSLKSYLETGRGLTLDEWWALKDGGEDA